MSTDKLPEIIYNKKNQSLIIHDLRTSTSAADPGLHLTPPEAGKPRKLYRIKDMFGDKVVRASQGLRYALENDLIGSVAESEIEEFNKVLVEPTLQDRLDVEVGKVPAKRTSGDMKAPVYKDPALKADAQKHVSEESEYDRALAAKREELKNDVLS